ncbi:galactose oxidase-like domain-containing protein [Actinoplanes sp. URMC 104]|uniref:galactose oxidase-like domain-containing protein n=1 Tax=Actinoplanes sp. URMC 104 TaxID=3423409 RepID=UPI003F1BE1B3
MAVREGIPSMRNRRYLIVSGLLSGLLLSSISGVGAAGAVEQTAATHDHDHDHDHADGHEDSREHMAQDLVGTPISVIEKETAQNAARIQRATGVRPGTARTKVRVAADPGLSGSWGSVVSTPVVPVFEAVLPNGKVLIWDSVGDNAAESYPDHTFTRAMVWNPADDTYKRVDLQGTNIFCAGFAHMSNGNILVAGGNANAKLQGTVTTYVFNWQAETWTRGKDMAAARWYPSVAETANGEEVIVGGGPATPEVYQTNGAIRALTGFTQYAGRTYPFMGSRPDGQLGLYGPATAGYTLTTAGNGVVTATVTRDSIYRDYGSFSTYDIGKSLVVGGGNITENGVAKVPTKTAVVLSTGTGVAPTVASTGSMSIARRQMNASLLADGSVLATGGMTSAATSSLVDLDNAATAAERWDPATGKWTVLASASRIRQYHSTAALLPDGRVMTGGGGICSDCTKFGYLEKNVEYFTPPYLYKKDGSGELATRPVISTAPAGVSVNTNFAVTSPQSADIRKVALVGLSDVTHGVDQGQRYVPLKFTASGTTLTVTGPPNGGVAPPGFYMLFLIDSAGVPSVARMVQVAKGPNPVLSPVKNSTGRCLDVPSSALAIRTYLQGYTCNNSKAQALTRLPGDKSLRVLGNCVDVPSSTFVAGRRIWAYQCNASVAQTWQFNADGTIRPLGKTTLCLAAASSAQSAQILLATCNGNALQKWSW